MTYSTSNAAYRSNSTLTAVVNAAYALIVAVLIFSVNNVLQSGAANLLHRVTQ